VEGITTPTKHATRILYKFKVNHLRLRAEMHQRFIYLYNPEHGETRGPRWIKDGSWIKDSYRDVDGVIYMRSQVRFTIDKDLRQRNERWQGYHSFICGGPVTSVVDRIRYVAGRTLVGMFCLRAWGEEKLAHLYFGTGR
jgi:hypothetical protein